MAITAGDFRNGITGGIAKINIFTDLCVAGRKAVKASNSDYLDMRNEKVEAIKNAVIRKMTLFGSVGKA